MANLVDQFLAERAALDADGLARVRARCRLELAAPRRGRTWRHEIGLLFGASAGLALAAGGVGLAVGAFDPSVVSPRLAALVALAAVGGLAAVAALKPGARLERWLTVLGAALAGVLLVWARLGTGAPSPLPQWVCSVSHLGAGLIPLAVAAHLLRRTAHSPLRALAAGLGAGTIGAILGELGCGQDAAHVVVHHLGAWAAVATVTLLVASRVRRSAFAP